MECPGVQECRLKAWGYLVFFLIDMNGRVLNSLVRHGMEIRFLQWNWHYMSFRSADFGIIGVLTVALCNCVWAVYMRNHCDQFSFACFTSYLGLTSRP